MDDCCAQCQEQFELRETGILEVYEGEVGFNDEGEVAFIPDDFAQYIHTKCASRYFNPGEEAEVRREIREEVLLDGAAQVNAYLGGVEKMRQREEEEEEVAEEWVRPPARRRSSRGGRWGGR